MLFFRKILGTFYVNDPILENLEILWRIQPMINIKRIILFVFIFSCFHEKIPLTTNIYHFTEQRTY